MVKLLKITGRVLGISLEWMLILLFFVAFAIRTASFQTYVAKKAASYLSEELGTKVKIDEVSIIFFDEVDLEGVLIMDQENDTLISTKTIHASIDDFTWSFDYFRVGSLELKEGYAQIKKSKKGILNTQFLKDYFKSDKPKKKRKIDLKVKRLLLSNVHFKYDDDRKPEKTDRMDYAHLDFKGIYGEIDDITLDGKIYTGTIKEVRTEEKCGFKVDELNASFGVSHDSLAFRDLFVRAGSSVIKAPKFALRMHHFGDFYTFVDSVQIDARISPSRVHLADVVHFAPVLQGMDDTVYVQSDISRYVHNLKLSDLDLRIKEETRIHGTLELPDYRDLTNAVVHERFDSVYVNLDELASIRLPDSMESDFLELDERVQRLRHIEGEDIRVAGFLKHFVVSADHVQSALGGAKLDNGMRFVYDDANERVLFSHSEASAYDVKVESFDLGTFIGDGDLGTVQGTFFVGGEAYSTSDILFTKLQGDVDRFDYLAYPYHNIHILEGSYIKNKFDGRIDVKDDNLDVVYDGFIDFNGDREMNFTLDLENANLDRLGFNDQVSDVHSDLIDIQLTGKDINSYEGRIDVQGFVYHEKGKAIKVPAMDITIDRSETIDVFNVHSPIAHGWIKGKLDFNHLLADLNYQFSRIVPNFFKEDVKKDRAHIKDHFKYDFFIDDADEFLAIFNPNLKISKNTHVHGRYFGENSEFRLKANSDSIIYKEMAFNDVKLNQIMDSNSIVANYQATDFIYNDSISFDNLYFKTSGGNNELESILTWGPKVKDASQIHWYTMVNDVDHYDFNIDPSHFSIKNHVWEIAHSSKVKVLSDTIRVDNLELTRNDQLIKVDGLISKRDDHQLRIDAVNVELDELAGFFTDKYVVIGKMNGWGFMSNPFNNFDFWADAHVQSLAIDGELVGDVYGLSEWNKPDQSVQMSGNLMYRGSQTFNFKGNYYTQLEKDNLQMDLIFDKTDIQFTNAFMDPDVLDEIKGELNGTVKVSGTPSVPELNGTLQLTNGGAHIDLLGTRYGFNGELEVDKYGFYLNSIPVFDQEGNAGSIVGSVYHYNFEDFNFDVQVDLKDDAVNREPLKPWVPLPLEQFLILDTEYQPGAAYYGKGYATGTINISGYTDNLDITVDLTSREGSLINFPMYGRGDIDSESSFIDFVPTGGGTDTTSKPKIDFTGVGLDLSLNVTPKTDMRIIFNEETGDIIYAKGGGKMEVGVNNMNEIQLSGTYTVTEGTYDFAMGVKKKFFLDPGGKITWTGNPYDALINLRTYLPLKANLAELNENQLGNSAHEDISCFLNLGETLLNPSIEFELQAPYANEAGRSLIAGINQDKDELNRQFLSLLLFKRFQPLSGTTAASGDGALDLITSEINAILDKITDQYDLNVNLDNDMLTGDNTLEFGIKRNFLDDRLRVSTTFGLESQQTGGDDSKDHENHFIGDVKIEYLLNKNGTFRIHAYNESNDRTVIQDEDRGDFTQGAGIYYQEDYNNMDDFKAVQYFLDVFRKKNKKRYPKKKKRQQVPVPPKNEND